MTNERIAQMNRDIINLKRLLWNAMRGNRMDEAVEIKQHLDALTDVRDSLLGSARTRFHAKVTEPVVVGERRPEVG